MIIPIRHNPALYVSSYDLAHIFDSTNEVHFSDQG
jgi:hypothetical protein